MDVEETKQWMADHAEVLRCSRDGSVLPTPAE
jgi:hypothetical protein